VTESGRGIISQITTGDLADEFQTALDGDLVADLVVGAGPTPTDWAILRMVVDEQGTGPSNRG
jgi:hypothetical protein